MMGDSFNNLAILISLTHLKARLKKLDNLEGVHDHKRIEHYEEFTKSVESLVGVNDKKEA